MEINKNIIVNEEYGDYIIFNKDTDKFYSLNEVSALIWKSITNGLDEKGIIEEIRKEYLVDYKTIEIDLKKILQELKNEKILL